MFTPLKSMISHIRFKWLSRFKKPFRERDWRYRFTDHTSRSPARIPLPPCAYWIATTVDSRLPRWRGVWKNVVPIR